MMNGAGLLDAEVLLQANHSVGMMVMGKNSRYQHDDVDKK